MRPSWLKWQVVKCSCGRARGPYSHTAANSIPLLNSTPLCRSPFVMKVTPPCVLFLSGVLCQAVMDRVTWRGSTPPTAARPAAPWRRRGRRTATSTARSLSGSPARRMAWAARPQAATARDTSVGASWPIGGGRGSVSLSFNSISFYCFSLLLLLLFSL